MSNRVFFTYEENPEIRKEKIEAFRADMEKLHRKAPLVLDFSELLPESEDEMVIQADFPDNMDAFATSLQKSLEEENFPALLVILPDDPDDKQVKEMLDKLNTISPDEGPNVFVFSNRDHVAE